MTITFITPTNPKPLTFGDVRENQFFVDVCGRLCQKYDIYTYTVITNSSGEPYSDQHECVPADKEITRILPHIEKIVY